MFSFIKKITLLLLKRKPIKYAKKIGVKIGKGSRLIGCPDFGSEPWLIRIGECVTVSSKVTFITHDGGTWVFRKKKRYENVIKYGKINIKNNCFVGARSIIMPGVTIGENSVVAAGSVVTKNVKPNTVVGGVPAKKIMSTEEYAEKSLKNSPSYDLDNYKSNKKNEILRILK